MIHHKIHKILHDMERIAGVHNIVGDRMRDLKIEDKVLHSAIKLCGEELDNIYDDVKELIKEAKNV